MRRGASTVQWVVGTVLVCVAGLVGSWLLLLGPMLDDAAATRAQADGVRLQNSALEGRLDALRAEFDRIGEYRAQLGALRVQVPDDAQLTALSDELDAAADDAGVTLVGIEAADSIALTGAVPAGSAPSPTEETPAAADPADPADATASGATVTDTTDTTGTTGTTDGTVDPSLGAATVDAAVPPVDGMVAIPLTVTVAGSFEEVRAFLVDLQTELDRRLLVSALNIVALEASSGENGARAADEGDIEVDIGALAFVLLGDADATVVPDGGAPAADAGSDPFTSSSVDASTTEAAAAP